MKNAFEAQQVGEGNPVTPREPLLPQQGPRDVVGAQQVSVLVDGAAHTADSTTASLRAGCKNVGVSQSGSKRKLFRCLVSHFEKKQPEVIYAAHPLVPVVHSTPQALAVAPGDFATISMHELTHLPYEPWCPICVASKGRAKSHGSNPAKQAERSTSVVCKL